MRISGRAILIGLTCALWLGHIAVLVWVGTGPLGGFLSDLVQLALALVLVAVSLRAAARSGGARRHYWRLVAISYFLLATGQGLTTYNFRDPSKVIGWATFLFAFWFVPLTMALFLDPESQSEKIEPVILLDFSQGLLFLVAAYFYFVSLHSHTPDYDLASNVRTPYLVYVNLLAAAFLFRSSLAQLRAARRFLLRIGLLLSFCCAIDVLYYYGPGKLLRTGAWFDALWSTLLVIPLLIAITWNDSGSSEQGDDPRAAARGQLVSQLFMLIFPALILLMAAHIARENVLLGSAALLTSFACSSARLLLTQKRLLFAQEALRREATHDGLTGVLNHAAILGVLHRELLRAERSGVPVGLMMMDVDRFKQVNDTHGHTVGDQVLRTLATELGVVLRNYDSLGRYGGEEFMVVVPGCGLPESTDLAERVRAHVESRPIAIKGGSISITVSIGVAAVSDMRNFLPEPLLQEADDALYRAKQSGRNRVEPVLYAHPKTAG